MAKTVPMEVVVKVEGLDQFKQALTAAQHAAWLEGMNHVLTWLALQRFGDAMAKDNPYGRKPATEYTFHRGIPVVVEGDECATQS